MFGDFKKIVLKNVGRLVSQESIAAIDPLHFLFSYQFYNGVPLICSVKL